jgi:hypothetical protein
MLLGWPNHEVRGRSYWIYTHKTKQGFKLYLVASDFCSQGAGSILQGTPASLIFLNSSRHVPLYYVS